MSDPSASSPVTCSRCGTSAPEQPLGWSRSVGLRGETLLCDACTRQHLRALEAKLDEEHW